MMNRDASHIPDASVGGKSVLLSKRISAIQLVGDSSKVGLFSQLGPGTTVERCGDGFDERTAKVRANGQSYFVFLQDIESQGGQRTSK